MQMLSWRPAAQSEQAPALVLVCLGLSGFLIDLFLRPVSSAGLVLLLLAATPSLIALLRRTVPADLAETAPATSVPTAISAAAEQAPRPPAAAERARPAPLPPEARATANRRLDPERRPDEDRMPASSGPTRAAAPAPRPRVEAARPVAPAQVLRSSETEPVRQGQVVPVRRSAEAERSPRTGL